MNNKQLVEELNLMLTSMLTYGHVNESKTIIEALKIVNKNALDVIPKHGQEILILWRDGEYVRNMVGKYAYDRWIDGDDQVMDESLLLGWLPLQKFELSDFILGEEL